MTKLKKLFSNKGYETFKTYIVAEIGINHEGNVNKCAQMIKDAVSSGADAIKLQTVNADNSYSKETESYKIDSKIESITAKVQKKNIAFLKILERSGYRYKNSNQNLMNFDEL